MSRRICFAFLCETNLVYENNTKSLMVSTLTNTLDVAMWDLDRCFSRNKKRHQK